MKTEYYDETLKWVDDETILSRTPEEYIELMFERTYPEGLLFEPVFGSTRRLPGCEYNTSSDLPFLCNTCEMNWTEADRDRIREEFAHLYEALTEIAYQHKNLSDSEEENAKILSPELLKVWSTYVRKFKVESFVDIEKIKAFNERLDSIKENHLIMLKSSFQCPLSEEENAVFQNCKKIVLNPSEVEYYDDFVFSLLEQAEQRLANPLLAYTLIRCTQRLFHLLSIDAPTKRIVYDARRVAQAFAINACAEKHQMEIYSGDGTYVNLHYCESYLYLLRIFDFPDSASVDEL